MRESPALDIIHLLRENGALVTYYDPFVPELDFENIQLSSEKDLQASVENADLVAIITNHAKVDYNMVVEKAQLVFDARNATKDVPKANLKVIKL
jgi:UDP-N-acetyl-D-glucosamine dehydrogenase